MKKLTLPITVLILLGLSAPAETQTGFSKAELTVLGMSCPLCSNNIHGRLKKVDGVHDAHINLETGIVTIWFEANTSPSRTALAKAIKESGFTLGEMELIK